MPYYPVLQYHADNVTTGRLGVPPAVGLPATSEFEDNGQNSEVPTPTETYDPSKQRPDGAARRLSSRCGPAPIPRATTPDQVFFRTDAGFDAEGRARVRDRRRHRGRPTCSTRSSSGRPASVASPLGDPVPFSAYLIGRLVNPTGYETQFNLDADRAYAYLTWDWIRGRPDRDGRDGHQVPEARRAAGGRRRRA